MTLGLDCGSKLKQGEKDPSVVSALQVKHVNV